MSKSNSFRFATDLVFAIAVLAVSVSHTASLQAQLVDWTNNTGATSPWYHDGGNWSGGSTPGSTETARFNQTGAYEVWWNETTANTNPNVGFLGITQGDVTFLNKGGDSQLEYTINGSGGPFGGNFSDLSISGMNTLLTVSGLHLRNQGGAQIEEGATLVLDGSHAMGSRLTIGGGDALNNFGFNLIGNLQVRSGAILDSSSTYIGYNTDSISNATITGAGSQWNSGRVVLGGGFGSSSTLNIENGGVVDSTSGHLFSGATVNVNGTGSRWNSISAIVVSGFPFGANQDASLNIFSGGVVESSEGYIANSSNSLGIVNVNGHDSQLNISGEFVVGYFGTANLQIESGGAVTNATGIVGKDRRSNGNVLVSGTGSVWNTIGDLYLGGDETEAGGVGTLTIADGGLVSVGGKTKLWNLGLLSLDGGKLATGTLDNSTSGTFNFNSGTLKITDSNETLYVDAANFRLSNGSTFNTSAGVTFLAHGQSLEIAGDTTVGNNATLNLSGGSLTTRSLNNTAGGNFNFNSGTLAITDSAQSLSVETNSFQLANGTTFNTNAGTTTLATGQHLNVAGDTTVASNATLNLNGGSLTTRSFDNTAGGTFQFNDGTLQVAGGVFNPGTNDFTIDGNSPAANPTLMLTDGASASFTGDVTVGNNNSGRAVLSGGSQISNRFTRLGVGANSTGYAQVSGAGSAWDVESNFVLGWRGDGILSVNSGGRVSSGSHFYVGYTDDSTGTVSVSGAGSEFNPWVAYIGTFGQSRGVVNVESGGKLNSAGIGIGGTVGSAGELHVNNGVVDLTGITDPGFGEIYVGWWGTGTATITNGGSVDAVSGRIGWTDSASGSVLVSGENSRLRFTDWVNIGDYGTGSLTIQDGGLVEVQNATVGVNAPGPGTGFAGTGTGNVVVTGNDSRFLIADKISIGENGIGTMTVSDGGIVTSQNVGLGEQAGSNGVLTVDGGSWTGVTNFSVGGAGKGTMTIRNGGTVSNLYGYIGSAEGIRSSVEMDGGTWHSQQLYVGNDHGGTGSLNAVGGSQLNTDFAYVGRLNGASGIVTLSGQDTVWNNSLTFLVGFDGNGTMNVEDGGRFDSADTFLGYYENRTGSVMVSDAGSQFNNANSLRVGFQGNGDLQINNGGVVTNNFGFIGWFQNSDGNVSVSDAGSRWQNNQSLYIGGPSSSGAGKGRLQIVDGGSVHVGNQLEVRSNGTLQIDGGHLQASTIRIDPNANFSMDAGSIDSPLIFANELIINGGTIDFERLAAFDSGSTPLLSQFGGVLAPGDSPGSTTIEGNYLLHAGTIEIELAGTTPGTEYDTVDVFGDFTINSGNLSVSLLNGFNLQFGQEFGFFNIGGALNGMFANLNEGDVVMSQNNVDLFITYSGGDGNDIRLYTQAVPEPGAAMLFGISCLMAGCHRRRRTSGQAGKNQRGE